MKLSTGVHSIYSTFIFIGLVLGMQACGGSSTPPPPADANPTGYYTGSGTVKTPGDNLTDFPITDFQIMTSGNRIMIMSDAKAVLYDGIFTVSGNDLTSTVTIYHNGDKQAATATLNATITEGSQLTGSFTGIELGNGDFVSTYNNLSNTPSNLNQVNNNFWGADLNESVAGRLEFELQATSTMLNSIAQNDLTFRDCNITAGSTYEPIAGISLFAVTIVFNACFTPAVEGTYTGLSQVKTATTLSMTVSNGTFAFADNFVQK